MFAAKRLPACKHAILAVPIDCGTPRAFKASAGASLRIAVQVLLIVQALAGCDNGVGRENAVPSTGSPPTPASFATAGHGHFRGTATIRNESYIAEALLTVDGAIRIAVLGPRNRQGPLSGAGLLVEALDTDESIQFIGNIQSTIGRQGFGNGVMIGENCSPPDPGRFCAEAATAEITLTVSSDGYLNGDIRITSSVEEETWSLGVGRWSSWYGQSASLTNLGGAYKEKLVRFAQSGDVIINITSTGQLFFQSAESGCIGNGYLSPHLDGSFYVFDVRLSIENCGASYDFLNEDFVGVATDTEDGAWDYDDWLLMFLSTPGWELPAAITMYAERMY